MAVSSLQRKPKCPKDGGELQEDFARFCWICLECHTAYDASSMVEIGSVEYAMEPKTIMAPVKQHLTVTIHKAEGGLPLDESEIKRIWSHGGKYEIDLKIV